MKKLFSSLLFFVSLCICAQTPVVLNNPSFEEGMNGWSVTKMTRQSNENFTKKDGTYYMQSWKSIGSKIDNSHIYQTVKGLKQGKYRLSVNACHVQQMESGSDVNNGAPQTGAYVYAGEYLVEVTDADTYVVDFSIIGSQNTIDIGAKSEKATGNYFAVDNFVLTYMGDADVADYKAALSLLIEKAQKIATSSTTQLNNAISAAQTEVASATSTLESAKQAYESLNAAYKNASVSGIIVNPSFEDGTNGWEVKNMSTQSNSVFSRKVGTYYLESWVYRGSKLSDASVIQTLKNMPSGKYTLKANALHIQQSGDQSTANTGSAQTGAYLVAGAAQLTVTTMKTYSLPFSVLTENANVEIGLKAVNPTGNYLCVDNFTITYDGEVETADYITTLSQLIAQGQAYIEAGIQDNVATSVNSAIDEANEAMKGEGYDDEGNVVYNTGALVVAVEDLEAALQAAKESRALYDSFQARIDYAEKVVEWWKDEPYRASKLDLLVSAIATAKQKVADYSLTTSRINSAISTLNNRISMVDKKIYCSGNACGSDSQLQNPSSQWCYERSLQSKHWILFWEKGYGTDVPAAVPEILNNADKIFEFYANDLGYININSGKSKTDTYKMIIRLRETTEWEASGSGIDDQIGLLTLSRWAYTSRGGQTVAHEIGHCFQYQTHCDNGNWNGWMYNWGQSTLNVFWEMCAQWQAYKFYPDMQFDNEWFSGTINGLHRHPLCVDLRYNNYFIQDYFSHKYGMKFLGRMWNESYNPEDPFQTYMRLTMEGTASEKLAQFNDEMWEYGARMTTFDMDPIRTKGASRIGYRQQTTLSKDADGYWWPNKSNCIENFGNNAIRLNTTSTAKTVYVEFEGKTGADGYNSYNKLAAGWRVGFVALQKNGTRVYGDIVSADNSDPNKTIAFQCPANCSYLWLVVSGAPTRYWTRDWLSWDSESSVEQWPYRVKFYQTNVYGQSNNNSYPTGIELIESDVDDNSLEKDNNVYSLTGQIVKRGSTSLEGLPEGIYIINGKKILKRN